jgi:mannose-6-phosphate isomerase-like protein (cupin superfamily)
VENAIGCSHMSFRVKKAQKGKITELEGIKQEVLIVTDRMGTGFMTLKPGSSFGEPYTHEGYETNYILKGKVEITVGKYTYKAKKGDVVTFKSTLPHTFLNHGKEEAKIFFVSSPPTGI